MQCLRILSALVALCLACGTASAQAVATQFVYPVGNQNSAPTKSWSNANGYHISQGFNTSRDYIAGDADSAWCADSQSRPIASTSEANCTGQGYKWYFGHTGVDLSNGGCNGAVIRAIANGVVEFSGSYPGYGNLLKIKHILPSGAVIHSLYGHRASVEMTTGQTVTVGQVVGHVGDTGAGGNCHLHLTIYADEIKAAIGAGNTPVGYVYGDDGTYKTSSGTPIPANLMRYFYDPLLFIDERNYKVSTGLACCSVMAPIFPSFSTTTKTAYVTDGTTTLSLQRAVTLGWLDPYLYEKHSDGLWYYYPSRLNLDEYVLEPGKTYGLIAKRTGLALHYFKPGNHYLEARARQDMISFVQSNSSFGHAFRETYGTDPNWAPPYRINWMAFVWNGAQSTWVNQACSTVYPLIRYVTFRNPATGQWSDWKQVY